MTRANRDGRYISWRSMVLGIVVLLLLFCTALYWIQNDIGHLQAEDAALQLKVNMVEADYEALQLELSRVGSDGYVENIAREDFGFIKDGEILFAFDDPKKLKNYTEEEYQIIMDELRH